VKIGGGGGYTPGIVFNPKARGVAYARTDIGGVYRLNKDDSWTPLQDYVNDTLWHEWGADAVATDPIDPRRVYVLAGIYTNSWDPNNASILRSQDFGNTWSRTPLPFKAGGNMPGRGMGERLVIDPRNNKILYLGARSGNGLWRSTDQGLSFHKVTSFTAVGTYIADSTDTSGYNSDIMGLATIEFDSTSSLRNGATSTIYVGTADKNASTWVSHDAGSTWKAMIGQPTGVFPHKMKFSAAEKALYITYNSESGPFSGGTGSVYKVSANGTFTDITPAWVAANNLSIGFGGLALDPQSPGTIMVAAMNLWWPDTQIFRSNNSGATWTTAWDWIGYPQTNFFTYDTDKAPWINASGISGGKTLGWAVETLEIDPFDSNHWLYATGVTIYGGYNLKSWPNVHISSLADGVEEEAVQALISPPGIKVPLISAVGDDGGFVHYNLNKSPEINFQNPTWVTTNSLDYAGLSPKNILRVGNSQLATSTDAGVTWALNSVATSGGTIAYAADASVIVWASSTGSFLIGSNSSSTIDTLPSNAAVAADKVNPKYFYAGDSTGVYVSSDGGKSFNSTAKIISYAGVRIKVHPKVAGDVWFTTNTGIFHSTDFGRTFKQIPNVQSANDIAVGKGSGSYGNVYSFNTVGNIAALRLSKDVGKTWTVISDSKHGFANAGSGILAASWDTAGLVFVGTNGRGVFYGLP